MKECFQGSIIEDRDGKKRLKMSSPAYFSTLISKLQVGKKVWVTVDERAPRRSEQQNRLYWQYLTYIEDETGNDKEDLHEYFATKYLSMAESILTLANGEKRVVRKRRSTTELSKNEFSYYLRKIELETNCPIPDTENYLYGSREEQIEIRNKLSAEYPDDYVGAPLV